MAGRFYVVRVAESLTGVNENGYHLSMTAAPRRNPKASHEVEATSLPEGRVASERLLGDRGELVIEHKGREYRLRLTQSGKLILTA
ncbi:MAG TPA: hemin uptake protein HemP [Burkholderiales bacterium]|nr:hemin uptake protein HemP [Burkholderiales bacterium]